MSEALAQYRRPAFPSLYATLWPLMVEEARECGYALALHGSLARDMDVIAAPWTDEAVPAADLVARLCQRVGFLVLEGSDGKGRIHRDPTPKPHGRLAWSLHMGGGAYIDMSVMPLTPEPASVPDAPPREDRP